MPLKDIEARREYNREYVRRNRNKLYELDRKRRVKLAEYVRELKIADCDAKFPDYPEVLEFDHIYDDKNAAIARMVSQGVGLATLQAEISKCEVVCANCHRIRTIDRRVEKSGISHGS